MESAWRGTQGSRRSYRRRCSSRAAKIGTVVTTADAVSDTADAAGVGIDTDAAAGREVRKEEGMVRAGAVDAVFAVDAAAAAAVRTAVAGAAADADTGIRLPSVGGYWRQHQQHQQVMQKQGCIRYVHSSSMGVLVRCGRHSGSSTISAAVQCIAAAHQQQQRCKLAQYGSSQVACAAALYNQNTDLIIKTIVAAVLFDACRAAPLELRCLLLAGTVTGLCCE
jgi:hypothetical protein